MSKTIYPGADAKTQWWQKTIGGSTISPNVLIWHTTEGPSFPSSGIYRNGATAPNITVRINIASRTMSVRQHFGADCSARALENRAGGVQTNTANAFQVEVVGTCDPRYRKKWGGLVAGRDYLYLPDAPDWALELLADIPRWLHAEWPGFPIADAAPRGWKAYPASYGTASGQRLSGAEWNKVKGMLGHQHVPENSHGDPGNLNIKTIVAAAKGEAAPVIPAPDPTDFLNPNLYPPAGLTTGSQITWLGERLVLHLRALGIKSAYVEGPGPNWGEADRKNVAAFQAAQGWTGADADGYPGPSTLARLAAVPGPAAPVVTPPPPTKGKPVKVSVLFLPMAGYNADKARGVTKYKANVKGLAALVNRRRPDFVTTTELSDRDIAPMRDPFDAAVPAYSRDTSGSDGRYVYRNKETTDNVAAGYVQAPANTLLNRDTKQAAWSVNVINGIRVGVITVHTENQDGVDTKTGLDADTLRVEQMIGMVNKALVKVRARGVADEHIIATADTNSNAWVKDKMVALGWIAVGPGHFVGWDGKSSKTLDWAFILPGSKATAERIKHDFSDHEALLITWTIPA